MPRAPWLLTSAWSYDCRRLRVHLIKLPSLAPSHAAATTADVEPSQSVLPCPLGAARWPQQTPLMVKQWPAASLLPHPEVKPVQKNWLPFVHGEELLVEYSIEPHVVLRVDVASGACVPVVAGRPPFTTSPPLARLSEEVGRVSGGAAPLHLPAHGVYLGMAHTKPERTMPQLLGTARMPYRHLFYAFEDRHPFAVVAVGTPTALTPVVLPEARGADGGGSGSSPAGVQFVGGMALSTTGADLTISFSSRDCGVRLASIPLNAVLKSVGILW